MSKKVAEILSESADLLDAVAKNLRTEIESQREEIERLKNEVEVAKGMICIECFRQGARCERLEKAIRTIESRGGKWMSACLSDPESCEEIKRDFSACLDAIGTQEKTAGGEHEDR